jgi:hypothetical protein
MCGVCFSRRGLLGGLAALSLAACSENAVTGRNQLVLVDDGQLAGLADQAWSEIAAQIPPVRDPAAHERLARIGRPLVAASGRTELDWSFTVLDSPDFNAFVLPNGRVGFFRGLFEFARSDAEIASVLGHEIGHIIARHPAERVSQELAVQAGVSIAQVLIAQDAGQWTDEIGAALGMGAVFGVILPYSRKQSWLMMCARHSKSRKRSRDFKTASSRLKTGSERSMPRWWTPRARASRTPTIGRPHPTSCSSLPNVPCSSGPKAKLSATARK